MGLLSCAGSFGSWNADVASTQRAARRKRNIVAGSRCVRSSYRRPAMHILYAHPNVRPVKIHLITDVTAAAPPLLGSEVNN